MIKLKTLAGTAVVALIVLAVAAVAGPAQATAPEAQLFELTGVITGPDSTAGAWSASGFVNDSGTYTEKFRFVGEMVLVEKTLIGSQGTILLQVQAVTHWVSACEARFSAGSWRIVGGTGAYARLKGGGQPAGTSASFANVCTAAIQITHAGQAHDD
jgi:hypothetical protein